MGTLFASNTAISSAMLNQYYGHADAGVTQVTGTSLTALSTPYSIPAFEPVPASAYELVCGGDGVWSIGGTLQFSGSVGGSAFGAMPTISASAFSNSAGFRWHCRIMVTFSATGLSGLALCSLEGCVTQQANKILPGTAADNTVALADSSTSGLPVDTTGARVVSLQAGWSASAVGTVISNRYTIFRKIS